MKYDYLLVGAGLFNATFAALARKAGLRCLVIEKRDHIAGNIHTENVEGINIHKYGAHIFHTDDENCWNFVNQFATFNRYTNSPVALIDGKLFNLPFNMNTFHAIWPDVITPLQAQQRIAEQAAEMAGKTPSNLEEQAISLVGRDIYELLIKGYTEKQWGRPCSALAPDIIKRLPLRFTYDNNYFNDRFQGIPMGGYTAMVEKMFGDTDIRLSCDFLADKENLSNLAEKIVYTGTIDSYFNYCFGELEYRSLRFKTEKLDGQNIQGVAVVNHTSADTPYTRTIEHKHFEAENTTAFNTPYSFVTEEYPADWQRGDEPYYPVNNPRNSELYRKYADLAAQETNVIFGGRLGMYRYFDMDDTIIAAIQCFQQQVNK
ncbi:MAG: UDP-galactopyranose mutase [Lentisphaerae bacterium]|nr:UDP-galactopyranose mutase [Lentisphaerota bacterium]